VVKRTETTSIVRTINALWCGLVLSVPAVLLAGESIGPCDRHAANSEVSWNPQTQFESPTLRHFYGLNHDIESSYSAGDDERVKILAADYLNLASTYRCNWNYGNAIHDANRYLGLVSLRSGHIQEADEFLLRSGKSPGSPQLDSFGPDLDLASELLKQGQIIPVKQYLSEIQNFWKPGGAEIDRWLTALSAGKRPELNRVGSITDSHWITAVMVFAAAWPELIVLAFLFGARKRLNRRVWFAVAGTLIVYALGYTVDWTLRFAAARQAVSSIRGRSWGLQLFMVVWPGLLEIAIPVLAIFVLLKFWQRRYGIPLTP
jgi:hypothetical protein